MARRPRLRPVGTALHIVQRGNNRATCFFQRSDYARYVEWLAEFSSAERCSVHAFCLMTNHVHLLATASSPDGASRTMKRLSQQYTQYVNRVHSRTGTLWEGRFRSCPVDDDGYALACYRYIELNPVRAGIVAAPDEYRWSSHRANALGHELALLVPHAAYAALGASPQSREASYRRLFAEDLEQRTLEQIREATAGNYALGGGPFQQRMQAALGARVIKATAGRPARRREIVV